MRSLPGHLAGTGQGVAKGVPPMLNAPDTARVYHITVSGQLWEQLAGHSDPAFIGDFASAETAWAEAQRRAVAGRGDRIVIAGKGAGPHEEIMVDRERKPPDS